MNITSTGPEAGGFALAGVRVKVTLTGTTRITANAGNFWTKIDCADYTGDYTGGHPAGLVGVIELDGTLYSAASAWAVAAGVVGEVRPVVTSSTTNVGGGICGFHAKVFAESSQVDTGSVVGVLVQARGGSASGIGILIQPHTGSAAWTVGLDFDSVYGAITTAIDIGNVTTGISFTGTSATSISISGYTDAAVSASATIVATGKYGMRVADIFTLATEGVHKAISGECTYTPSTSGFATPIGVSGMAALGANFTGGVGYMWGIQGVLSLGTSKTIEEASSVLSALRGVITGTTPTLNAIGIISGLYCDNLCATDLAGTATLEVCFMAGWNSGGSMDTCAYFYGNNDVASIFSFDAFAGTSPAIQACGSPTFSGTCKKLVIKIDGVTYFLVAATSIT